jgi:hypothetical protein
MTPMVGIPFLEIPPFPFDFHHRSHSLRLLCIPHLVGDFLSLVSRLPGAEQTKAKCVTVSDFETEDSVRDGLDQ